jgi:SAM-dependent methyltransferase
VGRRGAGGAAPLLLFPADREAAELEAQRLAAELVQHDRMRVHEADLSPPDMAGQACWAIETDMGLRWDGKGPARVLDPTAGAGCFPMAVRAQWPGAHIIGCEARAEEQPHLAHHCDQHVIGDFFEEPLHETESFDLVITNPPFTLIAELLPRCLELVRPGGLVAFVCRLTWGDKPEADRLWRLPFRLTAVFEFAGRWRFRVGLNPKTGKPYGVDSVGYRLLVWRRPTGSRLDPLDPEPTRIMSYSGSRLDLLPAACRRWRKTRGGLWVKPGTEYLHQGDLEALPPMPWRP